MGTRPSAAALPSQFSGRAVASLLRAASLVLALLFLQRVVLALAPLGSGVLPVALRFCDALVSQAPVAVLAICLLALSLLLDATSRSGRRLARSLRHLAAPVAIGYLLLIPLYGSALWVRASAETSALQQGLQASLDRLEQARSRVLQASSEAELQRIVASLPMGSPPLERIGPDLPSRRKALVSFFDQVRQILSSRQQNLHSQQMLRFLRDSGLYALACLALAFLFQRSARIEWPRRLQARFSTPARRHRNARDQLEHDMAVLLAHRLDEGSDPASPCPPADQQPTSSA